MIGHTSKSCSLEEEKGQALKGLQSKDLPYGPWMKAEVVQYRRESDPGYGQIGQQGKKPGV